MNQKMKHSKNSQIMTRGEFPVHPARQAGAILLIAMVVLVAMTLSALALIKSVNTTNLIAGNLGFRESALLASDRSMEKALNFLDNLCTGKCLYEDNGNDPAIKNSEGKCYWATRENEPTEANGKTWEDVMDDLNASNANCGFSDGAGNNVWYVIQRLCRKTGAVSKAQCSWSPHCKLTGSAGAGGSSGCSTSMIYYRITTRVNGPRNTAVYTQTVIAK
jgi:Tfp pilus assembly protein PilX